MLQQWPPTTGPVRGRVLLIHGLSSIANSWWQIAPALGARGWDATAVDQAGHGGRPVSREVTNDVLADAIREVYLDGPDEWLAATASIIDAT